MRNSDDMMYDISVTMMICYMRKDVEMVYEGRVMRYEEGC